MNSISEENRLAILKRIKSSKKYRHAYSKTILGLIDIEKTKYRKEKEIEKAVRERLHRILAQYVGDPNYEDSKRNLAEAFADDDPPRIKEACSKILQEHTSTRERLEILEKGFYERIFKFTGFPETILDLACGINPLTFNWMGLPRTTNYHAYDIHEDRVSFLNYYFRLEGMEPLAKLQDIAFETPREAGDVAFFLKEIHRFERDYDGKSLQLLTDLQVSNLVISFPTKSLHGGRNLENRYRTFISNMLANQDWDINEIKFDNELVYCVQKPIHSS